MIAGGFGSLRALDGQQYADRPGSSPQAAPEIVGQRDALTYLRGVDDLHWTYVSPPPAASRLARRRVRTCRRWTPSATATGLDPDLEEIDAIAVLDERSAPNTRAPASSRCVDYGVTRNVASCRSVALEEADSGSMRRRNEK